MTYGLLGSVHGLHKLWLFESHLLQSVAQARPKQAMHVSSNIIMLGTYAYNTYTYMYMYLDQ